MAKTNGTTEATETPSALTLVDQQFQRDHKGKTSKKKYLELMAEYDRAKAAVAHAEQAVIAARTKVSNAALVIMTQCCGKAPLRFPDGVIMVPMSKGSNDGSTTYSFRTQGTSEVVEF